MSSASYKYVVTSIIIEMTLKIFNTRLMWVIKLLVDTYSDIWIKGLSLQEGGKLQLTRQMPSCGRGTLLSIIIRFKLYVHWEEFLWST